MLNCIKISRHESELAHHPEMNLLSAWSVNQLLLLLLTECRARFLKSVILSFFTREFLTRNILLTSCF